MCECGHHFDYHRMDRGDTRIGPCYCGCVEYKKAHDPAYDPDDVAEFGYSDEGYPYSGLGKVRR